MYVGYYLHWSFAEITDLPHRARRQVIDEIGKINTELGGE